MSKPRLVIGTTNEGKYKEIAAYFAYSMFEVVPLCDVYSGPECDEPHDTLEANAARKAKFYAEKTGELVLAEDAGLFLDAVPEWPGVKSARIAPTKEERNSLVLAKLQDVSEEKRGAEFRICVAVYNPHEGTFLISNATERGRILLEEAHGSGGFGYDPLFYVPGIQKTYAELTTQEKNEHSHRGKALAKMIYLLKNQFSVKHIPVPCGIVIKDGKVLMNLRNDPHNPDYHRTWEFPGGGVEFGETPEENVVREVLEETGLRVTPITLLSKISVESVEKKSGIRYQVYLLPYLCKVEEVVGKPHDDEVIEMRWFALDEVGSVQQMPGNFELYQSFLPELKEHIAKHSL